MAKLCNTTIATLHHYDQKGILVPNHTNENGYRFYHITQIYTFDVICTLKEHGLSLKDIQEYLQKRSEASFVQLLKSNVEYLDDIIQTCTWKRTLSMNTILHFEQIRQYRLNEPLFINLPERAYLLTPLQGQLTRALFQHHRDRRTNLSCLDLTFNGLIPEAAYLEGNISVSHLCSEVGHREENPERYCTMPAGVYAVLRHSGSDAHAIANGIQHLLTFIQEYKLCPVGPMLIEDIINGITNLCHEDATVVFSVRAES